jgi:hypothetical protein
MTDAVVLLALSQLVCLGGLAYLYRQVLQLRANAVVRTRPSERVRTLPVDEAPAVVPPSERVRRANRPPAKAAPDLASVTRRMHELGVDVPALARRMQRSEDEIRILLRRQGAA